MSKQTNIKSTLSQTLARLEKMTSRPTAKKQDGESRNLFYSKKDGKNNLLVLPIPGTTDPFFSLGVHKGLLEVPYHTIECPLYNDDEECIVCDTVVTLKKDNFKGNMPIWKPIEQTIQYASPVLDLDDVSAGVQWWIYPRTVLTGFTNWLVNLEEDESPFYDLENFQLEKIIVNYDKDAPAADKYSLDKKIAKLAPLGITKDIIQESLASLPELRKILKSKKAPEEVANLLGEYLERMTTETAEAAKGNLRNLAD